MKKRILLSVYALLLCATLSFAWISNIENNYVNQIILDYSNENNPGSLKVVDRDMTATLYVGEKKNSAADSTDESNFTYTKVEEDGFKFNKKHSVPGAIVPFKIEITNNASESTFIKLTMATNVSDIKLLDVLFIDMVAGEGFNLSGENYHIYRKLNESARIGSEQSGDFLLDIYGDGNRLLVPNGTVTLNGFFFISEEATAEHQSMALNSICFRIE